MNVSREKTTVAKSNLSFTSLTLEPIGITNAPGQQSQEKEKRKHHKVCDKERNENGSDRFSRLCRRMYALRILD
jgi:hypothetical protein